MRGVCKPSNGPISSITIEIPKYNKYIYIHWARHEKIPTRYREISIKTQRCRSIIALKNIASDELLVGLIYPNQLLPLMEILCKTHRHVSAELSICWHMEYIHTSRLVHTVAAALLLMTMNNEINSPFALHWHKFLSKILMGTYIILLHLMFYEFSKFCIKSP